MTNESSTKKIYLMLRLVAGLALVLPCILGCDVCHGQSISVADAESFTARVDFGTSIGSAVAVCESDGVLYLATARHCTERTERIFTSGNGVLGSFFERRSRIDSGSVTFWRDGAAVSTSSCQVEWRSEVGDCAIISTRSWPDSVVVAEPSTKDDSYTGVCVFCGFPFGYGLAITSGRQADNRTLDGFTYGVVTSGPIPGQSGGPVIFGRRLVGVTCLQIPGSDRFDNAFHPFGKPFRRALSRLKNRVLSDCPDGRCPVQIEPLQHFLSPLE